MLTRGLLSWLLLHKPPSLKGMRLKLSPMMGESSVVTARSPVRVLSPPLKIVLSFPCQRYLCVVSAQLESLVLEVLKSSVMERGWEDCWEGR